MPSGILKRSTLSKSKSPKKTKSPKTRKRVVYSDINHVNTYSPISRSPSNSPVYPKCRKDQYGNIVEFPCKMKYTSFQNKSDYYNYLTLMHNRNAEDPDFEGIDAHYASTRKRGIPVKSKRNWK